VWWQEAVNLIEYYERPKPTRIRQRAHPRQQLLEQHAEHECTLVIIQMGHADDDSWRAVVARLPPFADVE